MYKTDLAARNTKIINIRRVTNLRITLKLYGKSQEEMPHIDN